MKELDKIKERLGALKKATEAFKAASENLKSLQYNYIEDCEELAKAMYVQGIKSVDLEPYVYNLDLSDPDWVLKPGEETLQALIKVMRDDIQISEKLYSEEKIRENPQAVIDVARDFSSETGKTVEKLVDKVPHPRCRVTLMEGWIRSDETGEPEFVGVREAKKLEKKSKA